MKKWSGCSSESKKCLFCNKLTSDYITYEVDGIELKISTHYECNKKDFTKEAKQVFRNIKQIVREEN